MASVGTPELSTYLKKTQERFARPFKPINTGPVSDRILKNPWAVVVPTASTVSTLESHVPSSTHFSHDTVEARPNSDGVDSPLTDSPISFEVSRQPPDLMDWRIASTTPRVRDTQPAYKLPSQAQPESPSTRPYPAPIQLANEYPKTIVGREARVWSQLRESLRDTGVSRKRYGDSEDATGGGRRPAAFNNAGKGDTIILREEANAHPLAMAARNSNTMDPRGSLDFARHPQNKGLLPDVDDDNAEEVVEMHDSINGSFSALRNSHESRRDSGSAVKSSSRPEDSPIRMHSGSAGKGRSSNVAKRSNVVKSSNVAKSSNVVNVKVARNSLTPTDLFEPIGTRSVRVSSNGHAKRSDEDYVSKSDFLLMKTKVEELQRQLQSAKTMLQDAIGKNSLQNSIVFSPEPAKSILGTAGGFSTTNAGAENAGAENVAREGTHNKSSPLHGSDNPPKTSVTSPVSPGLAGKPPEHQMKILLSENMTLKAHNESLRTKLQSLEQDSMQKALDQAQEILKQREDVQIRLICQMREQLWAASQQIRGLQRAETAWKRQVDVVEESSRAYWTNEQETRGVAWCLWAVPDTSAGDDQPKSHADLDESDEIDVRSQPREEKEMVDNGNEELRAERGTHRMVDAELLSTPVIHQAMDRPVSYDENSWLDVEDELEKALTEGHEVSPAKPNPEAAGRRNQMTASTGSWAADRGSQMSAAPGSARGSDRISLLPGKLKSAVNKMGILHAFPGFTGGARSSSPYLARRR